MYVSQVRQEQSGSTDPQLTRLALNTLQGRQCHWGPAALNSAKERQEEEGHHEGASVYVDSFRHVIYNTLWTSNRLIKYILYKYISYCTCCPPTQPP